MGYDYKVNTGSVVSQGSLNSDNGKFFTDGVNGNVAYGAIAGQGKAASAAIATGNTVVLPVGATVIPLTAAAAATGVIMPAGTKDGQQVILVNEGTTNAITMAASGTSNCALGTGVTMAAFVKFVLVWDATTALWY